MAAMRASYQPEAGQVTVETGLLLMALIAALMFAGRVYTQRAMQGYAFESGQALSTPLDPRDGFGDRSSNSTTETARVQYGLSMIEATHLKVQPADAFEGDYPAEWEETIVLESLPRGPVPREPAQPLAMQVTTGWSGSQSSNANVQYDNN